MQSSGDIYRQAFAQLAAKLDNLPPLRSINKTEIVIHNRGQLPDKMHVEVYGSDEHGQVVRREDLTFRHIGACIKP